MATRKVLIGPDVWTAYLREEAGAVEALHDLIGQGLARTTEAVGGEAIRCCASMEQAAVMREILVDLPPVEAGRADWVRAGELAWRLRAEGRGEVDLLEAHAALAAHREGADVLTSRAGLAAAAGFLGLEVRHP